jgi:predicted transcriptional regulator
MHSNTVATNKARLVAYCDPEVKEKLEKLAELRLRSLSNLIESVLADEVAEAESSGELKPHSDRK